MDVDVPARNTRKEKRENREIAKPNLRVEKVKT